MVAVSSTDSPSDWYTVWCILSCFIQECLAKKSAQEVKAKTLTSELSEMEKQIKRLSRDVEVLTVKETGVV